MDVGLSWGFREQGGLLTLGMHTCARLQPNVSVLAVIFRCTPLCLLLLSEAVGVGKNS